MLATQKESIERLRRVQEFLAVHAPPESPGYAAQKKALDDVVVGLQEYSLDQALGRRLRDDSEAAETKDAIGDHNDIRDGILEAARHEVGSRGWWGGVDAARRANDEHMGEEEHEGLRDFRLHVDLETRHRIAVPFVAYEAEFAAGVPIEDKDPDRYVEDQGDVHRAR